jgi:hypothetical protein
MALGCSGFAFVEVSRSGGRTDAIAFAFFSA